MAPLLLRCAIVGQRSVFTMEVDVKWSVGILLDKIGTTRRLDFPPMLLRVYVAHRVGDSCSAWLKTSDPDYEALTRGDAQMKALYVSEGGDMHEWDRLEFHFPSQPDKHGQEIHVLVKYTSYEELVRYWTNIYCYHRIATVVKSDHPSEAEPLYDKVIGPLRDSDSLLGTWIVPKMPTEVGKTKAA